MSFSAKSIQRAFTLLELLVVLVILGMLAAYVGPKYFSQLGKAEVKAAQTQMLAFKKALDTYRLDVGRYPSAQEGLAALVERPASVTGWRGPYLEKKVPLDPWGKPYLYTPHASNRAFELKSLGKDASTRSRLSDA